MRMYTCIKEFKTTLFNGNKQPMRIKIEKESDWFLLKRESNDRFILSNNKIELIVGCEIIKRYFQQWG